MVPASESNNAELSECTYCSPSGKPLGLQAGINPPKDRKERQMREGERERGIPSKAKESSTKCHMLQNSYSPSKVAKEEWRNIAVVLLWVYNEHFEGKNKSMETT